MKLSNIIIVIWLSFTLGLCVGIKLGQTLLKTLPKPEIPVIRK